jgi:hypothetical protein
MLKADGVNENAKQHRSTTMASGRRLFGSLINFGIALIIFVLAVSRIMLGYLPASRRGHAVISIANNPGAFWITIGLMLFGSFVFFIFGVLAFISAMKRR